MSGGIWNSLSPYQEPTLAPFRPTLLGPLERVAAPSGLVVAVDAMKLHLRVDYATDDSLIEDMIQEATRLCEEEIAGCRQFLSATYDLPVSQWWWDNKPIQIPRPPLQSIESITYYDTAGVQQTLAASYYEVHTPRKMPGWVVRAPNQVFPPVQCDKAYPITVRFVAGYGLATDVPSEAKAAIKLLVFDRYTIRGATSPAWSKGAVTPYGVDALLQSLSTSGYA